ncbi:MAG: hypothetical protein ACPGTQ_11970 [Colwellia sp.]
MDINDFTQLEDFLFKKKQRFVDMFLWQLHSDGIANKMASVGLHDDIRNGVQSLYKKYCNSSEINDSKDIIEYYIKKCNRSLIPEEHLNWLDKKNLRQCNFVWLHLKQKGILAPSYLDSLKGNSDKHYISVRALDLYPDEMTPKIRTINNIREAWTNTKNYQGWHYGWLDIRNELQCKKAVEFLSKKVSDKSNGYSKPPLIQCENELSDYYRFLASVDVWSTFSRDKQNFYKKISDAARKWKTPEQKKAQIKLKSKVKENNHILLKDKKSLKTLQIIQEKMGHKTPEETLKHIISEQAKQATFSETDQTPAKVELQEDDEANLKQPQNGKDELFIKKLGEIASELDIPPPRKS